MFKNYFKTAWRNLTYKRLYGILNIGGLGIAMAACFMLLLYVYSEISYDHQNEKLDRIYQVKVNFKGNSEIKTGNYTSVQVADYAKRDFPQIDQAAVGSELGKKLFTRSDRLIRLETFAASASLFDIFSFKWLQGGFRSVDPSSVVLTKSASERLFGGETAIGKTIKYDNFKLLKVAGVIEDLPVNASLQFDAFIPWETYLTIEPWVRNDGWYNYSYNNYILVKENADIAALQKGMGALLKKYDGSKNKNTFFLYPLSKVHLYNEFKNGVPDGGRIGLVRLFAILAFGILLIGCINFMNLSTARSGRRAKEVGVRKAMGAGRHLLILQFIGESVLMAFAGFVLAILLTVVLLPVFSRVTGLQLSIHYNSFRIWLFAGGIALLTGVISGSYPAFFLSSFNPAKVLKGSLVSVGNASIKPRQILVVLQFTFAICLIIASIVIYKQIRYAMDRPLGYSNNGLIEFSPEGNLEKDFEAFRLEAIRANAIVDGAISTTGIINSNGSTSGVTWPGQLAGEEQTMISQMSTAYHFVSTMGLQLKAGRDFSEAYPGDSAAILLNEAAVKMMRLKNPIDQQIKWQGRLRHVVGVVSDFSTNSPYDLSKPMIIGFMKEWIGNITLRLNPELPASESLARLNAIYKKMNPDYPFDYRFTDEIFAQKFKAEQVLGRLALVFTILAVIISSLGLFGLASFSAEQRRKEIGIRKVLGAGLFRLWVHLSKEFLLLILLSFVLGGIAGLYIMKEWLLRYEYHMNIRADIFVATLLLSLMVCLLTISYQVIKAATSNPVKALRSE